MVTIGLVIAGAAGHMGRRALCLLPLLIAELRARGIILELAAILEVKETHRHVKSQLGELVIRDPVLGYFDAQDSGAVNTCLASCKQRYADGSVLFYDASPATNHLANLALTERYRLAYLGEKPMIVDSKALATLQLHLAAGSRVVSCDFIETLSLPALTIAAWLRAQDRRVSHVWLFREAVGGIKKLLHPGARAGVAGGSLIDKSIHDLSLVYALATFAGEVPAADVVVRDFGLMPSSLDCVLNDNVDFLSTLNERTGLPRTTIQDVQHEAADAWADYEVNTGSLKARLTTSWIGVQTDLSAHPAVARVLSTQPSTDLVGTDQLDLSGSAAVPAQDLRLAVVETDDGTQIVADFLYKMKGSQGQRVWTIDPDGEVAGLDLVHDPFAENSLGRVLRTTIDRLLPDRQPVVGEQWIGEKAISWVHDTLVRVREAGLDQVEAVAAYGAPESNRRVRRYFATHVGDLRDYTTVKGVIFDLDNTLFRTRDAVESVAPLIEVLRVHYRIADEVDLEERLWRESIDEILPTLSPLFTDGDSAAKAAIWSAYGNLRVKQPIVMANGWATLSRKLETKGIRSAIVSSGFLGLQARKLAAATPDVQRLFRPIVIDDVRSGLGKRRLIQAVIEEWAIEPRQILVVGDSLSSEIRHGRALGCKVAHVAISEGCGCGFACFRDLEGVALLLD